MRRCTSPRVIASAPTLPSTSVDSGAALPRPVMARAPQGIGDVGARDRTEQRVLLVRLGRDVDLDAVQLGGFGARLREQLLIAHLALALDLLVQARRLGAGGNRELARDQKIAGV